MFNLFILILERVGLIIILAYLLMNIHYFRDKLGERQRLTTKLTLIIVFGIFAVISKNAVHFFVPAGAGNIFAFRSPLLLRNWARVIAPCSRKVCSSFICRS